MNLVYNFSDFVSKVLTIGSSKGLVPNKRQAIFWDIIYWSISVSFGLDGSIRSRAPHCIHDNHGLSSVSECK